MGGLIYSTSFCEPALCSHPCSLCSAPSPGHHIWSHGSIFVLLTPQLCIHYPVYVDICEKTKAHFAEHEELTLAEFRDMMNTSRKYALAVLEYYDKNKILKKDGDIRRMGLGF